MPHKKRRKRAPKPKPTHEVEGSILAAQEHEVERAASSANEPESIGWTEEDLEPFPPDHGWEVHPDDVER